MLVLILNKFPLLFIGHGTFINFLFCTYYLQYTRYWMERDLTFIIFQSSIQTGRKSYLHIEWKHRWIWMDLLYLILPTTNNFHFHFPSFLTMIFSTSPRPSFKSKAMQISNQKRVNLRTVYHYDPMHMNYFSMSRTCPCELQV